MKIGPVITAILLLLAGCGSKPATPAEIKPSGPPMAVDAYWSALTKIGQTSAAEMAPDMKSIQELAHEPDKEKQVQELLAVFRRLQSKQEAQIAKYQAINPPPVLAKAHAAIVQGNKDLDEDFRQVSIAFQARNRDHAAELIDKVQTIAVEMQQKFAAALDEAGYKVDSSGRLAKK